MLFSKFSYGRKQTVESVSKEKGVDSVQDGVNVLADAGKVLVAKSPHPNIIFRKNIALH